MTYQLAGIEHKARETAAEVMRLKPKLTVSKIAKGPATKNHDRERGLRHLDQWLRRKVRCYRLKQRKRAKPIAEFLMDQGVPEWRAWLLALSGKGWWRMAGSPQASEAMPIQWFEKVGRINLTNRYLLLNS